MCDLLEDFKFSVYDPGKRNTPQVMSSSGLWRTFDEFRGHFAMFVHPPGVISGLTGKKIYIHHDHDLRQYPGTTPEQRDALGRKISAVFCFFVHGVVSGWNTIRYDVDQAGDVRDEIDVAAYCKDQSLLTLCDSLGLSDGALRELCGEDILAYALRIHREKGPWQGLWTSDQFLASGDARFPYATSMAKSVARTLEAEGLLVDESPELHLRAELKEDAKARHADMVASWLEHLHSVGLERGWITSEETRVMSETTEPTDPRTVFVVHGRNHQARDAMFTFLRSIGLHPLEWSEAVALARKATPYVGDILNAAFEKAGAVVVLMTPDDEARLREQFVRSDDERFEKDLCPQARPNVLFEAGMAMGRRHDRTVLVELGKLRPFSDVLGRHVIRMNNSSERRQDLAQRLEAAGCPVNLKGTDWHSAGDFDIAVPHTSPAREVPSTNNEELETTELDDDEVEYLLQIAQPQNEGRISRSHFETESGREIERYRAMLEKFVELGILRDDVDFWTLTLEGYQLIDKLKPNAWDAL